MKRSRVSQILAGILVNAIYEMKNYPVVTISTVISPLSLLAVVAFVSNGDLLGTAVAGGLIMIFFSSGIALQSDLAHLKNDYKLQDMIVSSPTSAKMYLTGMSLAEIIYTIPGIVILVILASIYIHPDLFQMVILAGVLFLLFALSIAIGFMLATLSIDVVQSYAFSRLLSLLFTTLPPVYYPITLVPYPFNYLAYLSPTTYAAEIMHWTIGALELSRTHLFVDLTVLMGTSAIIMFVAVKKSRWREV
ncbi:MAG: ABC transporter permease [Nitrososphaerota archaeon]|nr:ABC transporter permease [Nitrososphaerota archaeon]